MTLDDLELLYRVSKVKFWRNFANLGGNNG